jgi:DNA-3-methyladenine glycosylase II
VQEAMRIGLGLKARPTVKEMQPLAEPWRPLRGAAAHLRWSYYHAIKKRDGIIPSEPKADATPKAKRTPKAKTVSNAKAVSNTARVAKGSPGRTKIAPRKKLRT